MFNNIKLSDKNCIRIFYSISIFKFLFPNLTCLSVNSSPLILLTFSLKTAWIPLDYSSLLMHIAALLDLTRHLPLLMPLSYYLSPGWLNFEYLFNTDSEIREVSWSGIDKVTYDLMNPLRLFLHSLYSFELDQIFSFDKMLRPGRYNISDHLNCFLLWPVQT